MWTMLGPWQNERIPHTGFLNPKNEICMIGQPPPELPLFLKHFIREAYSIGPDHAFPLVPAYPHQLKQFAVSPGTNRLTKGTCSRP